MNERIQQLAKEYGLVRWDHDSLSYELRGDIEDLLEFAELIVRECMLCCERVISDPVPKSVDTWLNGGKQCIDEIKYHFGVEE